MSDLFKSILNSFRGLEKIYDIDATPCVPHPKMPNYEKYEIILLLLCLCWILVIFEPYFLRIRHLVMKQYYPQRTTQRAVWLYNRILKKRMNFVKLWRHQFRTTYLKGDQSISNDNDVKCCQKLRAKFNELIPIVDISSPFNLNNKI